MAKYNRLYTAVATGADGETGPMGPTGPQGLSGPSGTPGSTGAQGNTGIQGFTGVQGPAGSDGATGATGPAGNDGAQGFTGPEGASGATGPQGSNGAQGPTGTTGFTGPQGASGVDGASGPSGVPGFTGATGPIGNTGAAGSSGNDGQDGATGSTGPQGETGATGPSGNDGIYGSTGPTGPQGSTGPAIGLSYAETVGDGVETEFTITHGLGTEDISVSARLLSTNEVVSVYVEIIDSNSITVGAIPAVDTDDLRVLVMAPGAAGISSVGATGPQGATGVGATGSVGATGASGPDATAAITAHDGSGTAHSDIRALIGAHSTIVPRVVGEWYSMAGPLATAHIGGSIISGRLTCIPVLLHAGTIDRIGVITSTAGAGTTWRLGVYPAGPNGLPDGQARMLDAGTVDMGATAGLLPITVSLSVSVSGIYWLAALGDAHSANPTVFAWSAQSVAGTGLIGTPTKTAFGADRSFFCRTVTGVTPGAIPTTCPTLLWHDSAPKIVVRAS